MATLLYRLGRAAYRRAIPVLIAWLVAAAGVLGVGVALGGAMQDSYDIPGTESQEAIDRLAAVFPQTAGASADIVVQNPSGAALETAYGSEIERVVTDLGEVDGVEQATSPYGDYSVDAVSADGSTAIIQVQFDSALENVTDAELDAVREAAAPLSDAGLTVAFGGQAFQKVEFGLSVIEALGVLFAAVVLIVTFGSLVAAGLPLLSALLALGISMGAVLALAAAMPLSTATPMLALMIGLAVGIDYALFILSRHRAQLAAGMDPEESAATSVATAGSSVVFAGVTVVIALVGLLIVGIPFLGLMGLTAALSVVLAMLAATTLLPAVLGLLGRRLAPKPGSRAHRRALAAQAGSEQAGSEQAGPDAAGHKPSLGERWVRLVLRAPVVFVIAVVGVLGTLAIPAFSLALALPDGGSQPEGTEAREAYDLVSEEFGPGRNGPLVIAVDITQTTDIQDDLTRIGDRIADLDGVAAVSDGVPNPTLDTAVIQVIPETGPSDPATTRLVEEIRELAPAIADDYGTPIFVTGTTAVMIDISARLDGALLPFGIVVVGLSVVLLAVVFRSILVPIKAALGYLLSVFASFGVVVAVFQWGWGAEALGAVPGPILSFMPILLMAILFGLAMDYEVFLVSGMREAYVQGRAAGESGRPLARHAVVRGFSGAARVVTAAALIMFFVFAAFVPEGSAVIKVIALGLAVGIAVDAFLIRMTLVPAVMALAGPGAWYLPRWLDRILPDVDIEGEGLRAHLGAVAWARGRVDAGETITLDGLVAGDRGASAGPASVAVPRGAIALADGEPAGRRLLAAAVAGRLDVRSGRAQVAGHPLPTEAGHVARLVALADLSAPRGAGGLGELLEERLRLTGPWYRGLRAHRRARAWTDRVAGVLGSLGRPTALVDERTPVATLPPLERAVALAALALAERTPVALLELVDPLGPADTRCLLVALDRLAPASTTVVLGLPSADAVRDGAPARVVRLTPAAPPSAAPLPPEGALR